MKEVDNRLANCILPKITTCRPGKNTVKSRFGVIHNWIFDIHSNVPWILQIPSTKQTAHNRGKKVICGASRLQIKAPEAAAIINVLLVKRNFIRNKIGK